MGKIFSSLIYGAISGLLIAFVINFIVEKTTETEVKRLWLLPEVITEVMKVNIKNPSDCEITFKTKEKGVTKDINLDFRKIEYLFQDKNDIYIKTLNNEFYVVATSSTGGLARNPFEAYISTCIKNF